MPNVCARYIRKNIRTVLNAASWSSTKYILPDSNRTQVISSSGMWPIIASSYRKCIRSYTPQPLSDMKWYTSSIKSPKYECKWSTSDCPNVFSQTKILYEEGLCRVCKSHVSTSLLDWYSCICYDENRPVELINNTLVNYNTFRRDKFDISRYNEV